MKKFYRFIVTTGALLVLFLVYKYSFRDDFLSDFDSFQDDNEENSIVNLKVYRETNPKVLVNYKDFDYVLGNDICKENGSFNELLGEYFQNLI